MKKTLFLLISGGAFSIAQAASVFVDVYRDGPGRDGMNQYTSNAAAVLPLADASGSDTPYTLKIVKSAGNFFNTELSAVTSGEGDPAYYAYYQNKAAMTDLVNTLGSFDYGALSSYMAPGAGGSTTSSIQLGGLTVGDTVDILHVHFQYRGRSGGHYRDRGEPAPLNTRQRTGPVFRPRLPSPTAS